MPRYDDTFVDRFLEPWNKHDVDGAFQAFIHELAVSGDAESLRLAFAEAGGALDLSCSAYLSLPSRRNARKRTSRPIAPTPPPRPPGALSLNR